MLAAPKLLGVRSQGPSLFNVSYAKELKYSYQAVNIETLRVMT